MRSPTDAELVDAARAGDRLAMEQLLSGHYAQIHSLCRRITGNDADADDATQESLLAIVRGIARFDGTSSFATWSYRVATNACLDELRRRRRRPEPVEPVDRTMADAFDPDGFDSAVVERDRVDGLLQSLPIEFRTAVTLRDLYRLDYAEIAEILDIPIGTVRSRIARGRRLLLDTHRRNFSGSPDVEMGDHG